MSFEIAFKRPLFMPGLLRFGEENPPPPKPKKFWSHTLGANEAGPFRDGQFSDGQNEPGAENNGKYDERGCRRLPTISPGEVQSAFALYEHQLIPTDDGALVRKNNFYAIPLLRYSGAPSYIFGRVKVCMPADGHIQDVDELELAFPQVRGEPERVVIEPHDANLEDVIQSYRIRVRVYGTEEDRADFQQVSQNFAQAGFALDFADKVSELLELNLLEGESLPWFHVIGSRWLAKIPRARRNDVRQMVYRLCAHETLLINYHPRHTVRTLNDELDFQHRLTEFYLSELKTPEQVRLTVRVLFEKIFQQPEGKHLHLTNRQDRLEP